MPEQMCKGWLCITRSLPICWCALVTESAHEIGLFHYRVELLCREYTAVPARQMARWINIMSAPVCRWLRTQRRMQHKPLQRSDHAALRCNLSAGRIASATGVAKERPADCAVQSKSIPPVGRHRSDSSNGTDSAAMRAAIGSVLSEHVRTLTRSPRPERRVHDDSIERIRRSRLERAAPEKVQRARKHVRLDELHGRANSKRSGCGEATVWVFEFDTEAFAGRPDGPTAVSNRSRSIQSEERHSAQLHLVDIPLSYLQRSTGAAHASRSVAVSEHA